MFYHNTYRSHQNDFDGVVFSFQRSVWIPPTQCDRHGAGYWDGQALWAPAEVYSPLRCQH